MITQTRSAPDFWSAAGALLALQEQLPPLTRANLGDTPPLSFAQERLWFLDQLEPDSRAYNQPKLVRLEGTLDRDALQKAFDAMVARHEVLRTTFDKGGEHPVQIDDLGLRADPLLRLPVGAQRRDLVAAHRDGLRGRGGGVHGNDLAVAEHQVGGLSEGYGSSRKSYEKSTHGLFRITPQRRPTNREGPTNPEQRGPRAGGLPVVIIATS